MSELRQDLVSGDWIIMAPERLARPHTLLKKKVARKTVPISECPFEDVHLRKTSQWPPVMAVPTEKNWRVLITPNKFPALRHIEGCAVSFKHGPLEVKTGAGAHDLVITRNHHKSFADLALDEATQVFLTMQERYRQLRKDPCNSYPSGFFNYGITAGASIYHPHYQILTLPIVPPDVRHSLDGSRQYFAKHKKCVHCVMLKFDEQERTRIIDQNQSAISLAPYVSRSPFEIRVFPKKHLPRFEDTTKKDLTGVVSVLQSALRRIKKNLNDPDLNFFIHTAPFRGSHDYYHWHVEIDPKITLLGGFELGTGIDINIVDPEVAARILRGKKARS